MHSENICGIYCITNKNTGRVYVGSTINIRKRFNAHKCQLRNNCHDNLKLQRAWLKYGEANFELKVIETLTDQSTLIFKEQYWIDFLGAIKNGYNLCPAAGTTLGIKRSDETKALISAKAKARGISPETRKKMSEAMRGRKQSHEHIAKVAASRRGKPVSAATKLKLSLAHTGKKHTPEQIAKHKAAITGRKPSPQELENKRKGMHGHVVTEATREKISASNKGRSMSVEMRLQISIALTGKKKSIQTIETRKATIANMPEDKKQAWRKKLSITSTGRKRSHESIAKALATRKANLVMKNL